MGVKNTKTFDTLQEALDFCNKKQGELRQKQNGRYQVSWGTKMIKNPPKYKTVSFKSLYNATKFCERLKKEGLIENVNQDIKVKTINDILHNVKFKINHKTNTFKYKDDFDYSDLAYNGVADDF